ncbi:MAG: hypothetical protein IPL39_19625 [Opitutaceae bacterium]|nr:hypothetical protein [Opitutaceae bacterium]
MTLPRFTIRAALTVGLSRSPRPSLPRRPPRPSRPHSRPTPAGNLLLHWPGSDNKLYQIESSPDLRTWTTRPA